MVFNEVINVKINGILFSLKVVEDSHGPLRISMPKDLDTKINVSDYDLDYSPLEDWQGKEEEEDFFISFEEDDNCSLFNSRVCAT